MKNAGIDVIRNVWHAEYEPLVVQPSADCPGYVRLAAVGQEAIDFWGKFDLTIPRDMALALADAIRACAEEQPEDA